MTKTKHIILGGFCLQCGDTEEWLRERGSGDVIPAEINQIVYLDGEEGREIVDALYSVEGVVAHGRTAESISAAVDHLASWEAPGDAEITTEIPWGSADQVDRLGDYFLSSNLGLGYVALARVVNA